MEFFPWLFEFRLFLGFFFKWELSVKLLKDLSQCCQYHWGCSTIKITIIDLLNKTNLPFMVLMLGQQNTKLFKGEVPKA